MLQLSWDLHLHPGPSAVPRWGGGLRIWHAAREAGVRGFVWKSHEHHTVLDCAALPSGDPAAIASASLNPWATPEDVIAAVESGARWIWGPSQDADGCSAWDLPLPRWWPALRDYLGETLRPLVLAAAHLDRRGRAELADVARERRNLHCVITHSAYVPLSELRELGASGCSFELDLYTFSHPIPGRPVVDLLGHANALLEWGHDVYVTSDAGQDHVGHPFRFTARALAGLAQQGGEALVTRLAVEGPDRFVSNVLTPRCEPVAERTTA